jgi:hypothetical protein
LLGFLRDRGALASGGSADKEAEYDDDEEEDEDTEFPTRAASCLFAA